MSNSNQLVFLGIIVAVAFFTGLAGIVRAEEAAKQKVVLVYGVYTQWYKFDEALSAYEVRICNAARPGRGYSPEGVENYPDTAELFEAKLLILSDVHGSEFTDAQIKQMQRYVEGGGSLLVMGGPFTLGLGDFKEKGIAEMLPVSLEAFDLKWAKRGKAFTKAVEHPIFKGVDLAKKPMVYWIHQVKPRKGARVLMTAGNYPCLVVGTYGKGKVAVFTGTPMGLPREGQLPFWEWKGWTKLVRNIAGWLTSGEGK